MARQITEAWIQAELHRIKGRAGVAIIPNRHIPWWYEADAMAITKAAYWSEYEIKLSLTDYKADFEKAHGRKHERLKDGDPKGPKTFNFVMPAELAEQVAVPEYAGLIAVTQRGPWLKFQTIVSAPARKSNKLTHEQEVSMYRAMYHRWWDVVGSRRK